MAGFRSGGMTSRFRPRSRRNSPPRPGFFLQPAGDEKLIIRPAKATLLVVMLPPA